VVGEPDAGKPHVRFDEGELETCGFAEARQFSTLPAAPMKKKIYPGVVAAGAVGSVGN